MAQVVKWYLGAAALLLKDTIGEKRGYWKKKETTVLRGTLLMALSKDAQSTAGRKPAHNYSVYKEDTTLFCDAEEISPLTDYDFQLLQGISKPGARFDTFITLDWGSRLRVGDTVYVELPTKEAIANTGVKGVIRWIGTLSGEEGTKFGIEITEGKYCGSGYTNGVFQGQQLFVCEKDCGLFVSLDKLAPTRAPNIYNIINIRPANPKASKSTQAISAELVTGTHSTQTKAVFRFVTGDRVVCYNKDQIPVHGTVRWIGEAHTIDSGKVKAVGIETDVPVQRGGFLITLAGLHQMFKCKDPKHGKIVVPEELVQTEVEATHEKIKINHDSLHLQHREIEMLRDANIESDALDEAEQKKLLQQYNKERDEKRRQQNSTGAGKIAQDSNIKRDSSSPNVHISTVSSVGKNQHQFVIGSRVQFGDPPRYGEIRWMGNFPQVYSLIAGVELDEPMDDCTDGTWKGQRYFSCYYGRAFFCPVTTLKPQVYSSTYQQPPTEDDKKPAPQTTDTEKLALELKLVKIEEELNAMTRELESKSHDLAAMKKRSEMFEKRAIDAEIEKDALSARVSFLVKALQGKTKELAAHNTEVWRIPANKVTTHRKIGAGAWGEVMEGTVRVAIKTLHEAITFPKHVEKLEREMKLLAEVRHPNLVQFIGAVFDDQNQAERRSPPTIITELLDMNLRQAYERNVLVPGNRLSIFKDIARALDYLHQRYEPIIHRDVSAPNILLQEMPNHQWKGKVSDLGSANFLQQAHTAGEGALIYSPPEVIPRPFVKPLPQTVKIDVYSYSIILCEVTTSRLPTAENTFEMIQQIQRDYPTLHELINRCTKHDPSDRPSMAEVLVELNKMTSF